MPDIPCPIRDSKNSALATGVAGSLAVFLAKASGPPGLNPFLASDKDHLSSSKRILFKIFRSQ